MLEEARRPMGTDELAEGLGLHPNGVRAHLVRLHQAGLVDRTRRRMPRGRPHDEWSIAPDARPGGDAPTGYEQLAGWLALAIPAGPKGLREVEGAGRRIGRELAPSSETPVEVALASGLAALGFAPAVDRADRSLTCTLGNCPYRDAVKQNPEVVCTLHRGLTRGLLDVIEPGAELTAFVPRDPDRAGCLIEIEQLPERAP